MGNKILFVLLVLISQLNFAQKSKFGKVTLNELELSHSKIDSSASAEYLYKERKTYFDYSTLVTDIYVKIKIYKKSGSNYASHQFSLIGEDTYSGLKAVTYNNIKGKVEKTKIRKEAIFETIDNDYFRNIRFTLPNIKEGSIIEYKYQIRSPIPYINTFYFEYNLPVVELESYMAAPEFLVLKMNNKGYNPPKAKKQMYIVNDGAGFQMHKYMFNVKNIKPIKSEPYVDNINNYRDGIDFEIKSIIRGDLSIINYSNTWKDVVGRIYSNSSFGTQLNKVNYFKNDLQELLKGVIAKEDKINKIFNFVKKEIKWNGSESKYVSYDGIKSAYLKKVGNSTDINFILVAMLREAGINANPILLSTKKNGVPLFPTINGLNYVACGIELPNKVLLLDATNKNNKIGVLPAKLLNWDGLIVRESGSYNQVSLVNPPISKKTIMANIDVDVSGKLSVKVRKILTNNLALKYRSAFKTDDKYDIKKALKSEFNLSTLIDYKVQNFDNSEKPLIESFSFEESNLSTIIGDKIIIKPLIVFSQVINQLKKEDRKYPVNFGFPKSEVYHINISIPNGYEVNSLPENLILKMDDDLCFYKFLIQKSNNKISVNVVKTINKHVIPSVYYKSLKTYYTTIVNKESESIIVEKIK